MHSAEESTLWSHCQSPSTTLNFHCLSMLRLGECRAYMLRPALS